MRKRDSYMKKQCNLVSASRYKYKANLSCGSKTSVAMKNEKWVGHSGIGNSKMHRTDLRRTWQCLCLGGWEGTTSTMRLQHRLETG